MDSISERSNTVDGIGFSTGVARIADKFPGDFLSDPVNAAELEMLGEFGGSTGVLSSRVGEESGKVDRKSTRLNSSH